MPRRIDPLHIVLMLALAHPAGAQVRSALGADAAASQSSQSGTSLYSGGVAPIGQLPVALSPAVSPPLSAPAASLSLGLKSPALTAPRPAAAAVEQKPLAQAVAASAASPAQSPYFVQSLAKLGVPSSLTGRLEAFLASRHPGDQDAIYHGLAHSHEVADLTARIVSEQRLAPEKQILLILSASLHDLDPDRTANTPARVPATLAHLDSNDEARGLLVDYGSLYGFTAAQVKALIMATDFSLDPGQMQTMQDAFAKAAASAFPSEPDWALNWGRRLAFADQSSTYVDSLAGARKRVEGLAVEIRAQLEAVGKGPGPSNAVILAGTYKFLTALKQNPLFALLPAGQSRSFDEVRAYFEARQTPEAWAAESAPVPARAPPVPPDLAAARRYINDVMGGVRAPTELEVDTLLGDWLDEKGIPRQSPRAQEVRAALLPAKAASDAAVASALKPALRGRSALLIRIASEHGVAVPYIESLLAERGLLRGLGNVPDESLQLQIEMALTQAELTRAVAAYPDNEQGRLMRSVADVMGVKSGKSVEEVSREGIFLYADFDARRFLRGYASRDPDIQGHTIAFYVTRREGRWRLDGYRQQKSSKTSDAAYIDALKSWLRAGGVPASDFH